MQPPKLVYILTRLNEVYLTQKTEDIVISTPLTIEHILPQEWTERWPLSDDSAGLKKVDSSHSDLIADCAGASRARHDAVDKIGNLTIVTQPLNSALSNASWSEKRLTLQAASLLPINQQLNAVATWDESEIEARSARLYELALQLWPGPGV